MAPFGQSQRAGKAGSHGRRPPSPRAAASGGRSMPTCPVPRQPPWLHPHLPGPGSPSLSRQPGYWTSLPECDLLSGWPLSTDARMDGQTGGVLPSIAQPRCRAGTSLNGEGSGQAQAFPRVQDAGSSIVRSQDGDECPAERRCLPPLPASAPPGAHELEKERRQRGEGNLGPQEVGEFLRANQAPAWLQHWELDPQATLRLFIQSQRLSLSPTCCMNTMENAASKLFY